VPCPISQEPAGSLEWQGPVGSVALRGLSSKEESFLELPYLNCLMFRMAATESTKGPEAWRPGRGAL
jgi:hypothetical protein